MPKLSPNRPPDRADSLAACNVDSLPRRRVTRVFILSDDAIYRHGLRSLIDAESDFTVVGWSADCAEVTRLPRQHPPDILLLDLAASHVPSDDIIRTLTRSCPAARIILLTTGIKKADAAAAVRVGVRGIVMKGVTVELFLKSIRAVVAGEYWVERETVAELARNLCVSASSVPTVLPENGFRLTARELQIVSLLIGGCPNKEIATKCGIRESTVKQHLTNVFDKVGVSNRLELALFALQRRLVIPGLSDGASSAPGL